MSSANPAAASSTPTSVGRREDNRGNHPITPYNHPMVPGAYAVPAAVILVTSGALACFGGFRLFRIVLGVYGFILGAMVTTSVMGTSSTGALILAAVVGGLIGAVLMIAAYFVGVGLIGAALASLAVHLVWSVSGGVA